MSRLDDRWLDDEAGPVVRPYALTGGRTRAAGENIDVAALVSASSRLSCDPAGLAPEHAQILRSCQAPVSVAELASGLDLPLGVLRILLADLRERGLIQVHQPGRSQLTDPRILQQVADGLRRLLPPRRAGLARLRAPDEHQGAVV